MAQRIRNTHYKYGEKPKPTKNPAYDDAQRREISRFYQEKLAAAEAERQQLMFDMEQEAEPGGGKIADKYGKQIDKKEKEYKKKRAEFKKLMAKLDKLEQY